MPHQCRGAEDHPQIPHVGSVVLFVQEHWGPAALAKVTAVRWDDPGDLNVYRWKRNPDTGRAEPVLDGDGNPAMVDWPNPNLDIVLMESGAENTTRQIRYDGSPGWTWYLTVPDARP